MVFADLIFLYVFLPLNLILYYKTKHKQSRNLILILFSLFFYAWGEPVYIVLLLFSATIDYIHGIIIEDHRHTIKAKLAMASCLILNLGLLGIFKYADFAVEIFNTVTGLGVAKPGLALPIGISFYTFQTISYVIDVYRDEVKAQRSYGKFLLFVSSYHQLVAGPIVRYTDIAAEIENRSETIDDISKGIARFCVGLAKKTLIANTAGALSADYLGATGAGLTVAGSWFGILMFALQIYYDFSGYSDMAIGLGMMFGFHYVENFNYPYISTSVTEFWRRWHISLGSFFRDYVYIPLGGGRSNVYRNLFITWMATGLWHGASMNFVLWGLYYGVLIALERLFLKRILDRLPRLFSHVYLLLTVLIGWVLFYFEDMSKGWAYLRAMFGAAALGFDDLALQLVVVNNLFWLIAALVFTTPVFKKLSAIAAQGTEAGKLRFVATSFVTSLILLVLSTISLIGQSYNPFLYFRF